VCSGTVEERSARLVARTFLGGGAARERGPLLLELDAPEIAAKSLPGQFLLVTCGEGSDPFLLRPLAVAGVQGEVLSLLVQVRGEGTRRLAALAPGSVLRLRGPLGTPFTTPKEAERLLYVAGGVGAAPLLFMAERWGGSVLLGVPDASWKGLVRHCVSRIGSSKVTVLSDDGSLGEKGNPCSFLASEKGSGLLAFPNTRICACGPTGMLAALVETLPPALPYEASLETRMGCGYGGCLGCVVPTERGRLRACVEGPVFAGREVRWHELG